MRAWNEPTSFEKIPLSEAAGMLANQCSRFGVYDDLRDGRWSQGMQTPIGHTVCTIPTLPEIDTVSLS